MGDNTVYSRGEGETTEWDDLMVNHGHKEAPKPVWKPEAFVPAAEGLTKDSQRLDKQSEDALEGLDDDFADDRVLEKFRQKRIKELRRGREETSVNSVKVIKRADFVREVTDASTSQTVVVHLTKDKLILPPSLLVNRLAQCAEVASSLEQLAAEYPATKFVKIASDDCVPGYPDSNLPTVFVYKGKKVILTLAGTGDFGDTKVTPEWLAQRFVSAGAECRRPAEEEGSSDAESD